MAYTEGQLRFGGKRFARVLRENPGAPERELARIMGETVDKVRARLASRARFLGALRSSGSPGREVVLPHPRRESRFALLVDLYCRCEHAAGGRRHSYHTRWSVWFPKSALRRDGPNWLCPQNYYEAKRAEARRQAEFALAAGVPPHCCIRLPEDPGAEPTPLPEARAAAPVPVAGEPPAALQPELFAL